MLNSRTSKFIFGAVILLALPVIGTTLAASISINSGSSVQFGQGVIQATACDEAITVTANTSFTNASGAGSFNVDTITLSGIADACSAKTFTVRAYDTTTATPLTVNSGGTPTTALVFAPTISGSCTISVTGSTFTTSVCTYSSNNTSVAIKVPTTLSAASVYKFTLETS
ncbi:MAG: hypothetical protein EBY68_06450 [Actinobacteria bacterium]|nr:hypothetical protein [Actinomycetota bacterium]